jgi:hypothetical protein
MRLKSYIIAAVALLALGAVRPPKVGDKDFARLQWNYEQGETQAIKFRVYYGKATGTYEGFVETTDYSTQADVELTSTGDWYFVATAVADNGLESEPSNEVRYTVVPRPNAPNTTRVTRFTLFVD